jgi:hypothetical protein
MKNKLNYYFYKTTNLINGKFYYGSGQFDNYVGSGIALGDAIKKYDKENFLVEKLKYFSTRKEAFDFEDRFLKLYNISKNPMSYNMKDAALGGDTISNHPNRELISSNMKTNMKGENNPMYRLSLKGLWILKYGTTEANKRYENWLSKVKSNSTKNIKVGSIEERILKKYGGEEGHIKIIEYRKKSSESRKGEKNHRFIKVEDSIIKAIIKDRNHMSYFKLNLKYDLSIKVIKRIIKTNNHNINKIANEEKEK